MPSRRRAPLDDPYERYDMVHLSSRRVFTGTFTATSKSESAQLHAITAIKKSVTVTVFHKG